MKIRGITVGTTIPKPSWLQSDPSKGDYIKNKPDWLTKVVGVTIDYTDGHASKSSGQIATYAEAGNVVLLSHNNVLYSYVGRVLEDETDGPAIFERIREEDGVLYCDTAEVDDDGYVTFDTKKLDEWEKAFPSLAEALADHAQKLENQHLLIRVYADGDGYTADKTLEDIMAADNDNIPYWCIYEGGYLPHTWTEDGTAYFTGVLFGKEIRVAIGDSVTVTEAELEPDIPYFDLAAMGLPGVLLSGGYVSITGADFSGLCAALDKGPVKLTIPVNMGGETVMSVDFVIEAASVSGTYSSTTPVSYSGLRFLCVTVDAENISVGISTHSDVSGIPAVTADDDGKILQVWDGAYVLVDMPESEGGGTSAETETAIFPLQEVSGFADGMVVIAPAPFALVEGEEYRVVFDGVEYNLVCQDLEGHLILTDTEVAETGEPASDTYILINHAPSDDMVVFGSMISGAGDPATSHTIGIYQTVTAPELPAVSSADNGKILQVVDGAWAAVAVADSAVKTYVDSMFVSLTQEDYDALVEAGTVDETKYYLIEG